MNVKLNSVNLIRTWEHEALNPFQFRRSQKALVKIGKDYFVLSESWPMDTGHEVMMFRSDAKGIIDDYSPILTWYDPITLVTALERLAELVSGGWIPES